MWAGKNEAFIHIRAPGTANGRIREERHTFCLGRWRGGTQVMAWESRCWRVNKQIPWWEDVRIYTHTRAINPGWQSWVSQPGFPVQWGCHISGGDLKKLIGHHNWQKFYNPIAPRVHLRWQHTAYELFTEKEYCFYIPFFYITFCLQTPPLNLAFMKLVLTSFKWLAVLSHGSWGEGFCLGYKVRPGPGQCGAMVKRDGL